ncbi:peptidoglycan DD-metalloendopeptidase family protein [Cellulophaga sp. F20128]|uniref:peptidoglycan DD-metalloendopeptidase family protein n=1 Tax=Cellulophaga sp. F20128 TaxID=2926413 RepID=UPI001FF63439|nr:peptidoglycan DD-metalloendopeptidase family protein [Cellulophaga sp. F20128]
MKEVSDGFISIIENSSRECYTPIDLSRTNADLINIDITSVDACQKYIDAVLTKNKATVAYGGYLEKRNLYATNAKFSGTSNATRNIHLGMDFWTNAGANVLTPLDGVVHSYKDNAIHGDYGPTIILKHSIGDAIFYSLYGHLAVASLQSLYVGKVFKKGSVLASLGDSNINVGYAPHLHFQLIMDIKDYLGDYPGVCASRDLEFYAQNCPNPKWLLHF